MISFLKNLLGLNPKVNLSEIIKGGAFLVDVRTPGEFAQGHVKGSVNIPLDKITNQIPKFSNRDNIIVFCRSGNRSSQAKSILARNGITNVFDAGTWQNVNQYMN
jgi:rhodanese-related sulfurtransferase